jgi:hypothetical protein
VDGDISAVAKALRDFSRANPLLVIKGGLADGSLLSSSDLAALAELPSREVLLARLAGAIAAPMQQMAGLLQALPRNLAYGMQALIDQRVEGGEAAPAPEAEQAEAPAAETDAPAAETSETEAPTAETAETEAEAPAAETETETPAAQSTEAEAPAAGEAEGSTEAAATSDDAAE